jgi:hypothetical protein
MVAEYAATMYLLFLFIFFPLLDLTVLGLRSFFLWFACNQGCMAGCKARTWGTTIYVGQTQFLPATSVARNRIARIQAAFRGCEFKPYGSDVTLEIQQTPIPGSVPGGGNPPAIANSKVPLGIGNAPNVTEYIPSIKCTISAKILPFIPVPLFNIPGLSTSFPLTVSSEQVFENPPGLQI